MEHNSKKEGDCMAGRGSGTITQCEIWKDIKGHEEEYQISNYGRVRAKERLVNHSSGGKRKVKEKILNPFINSNGYYQVNLYKGGKVKPYTIHKLVMLMFVGERPENTEIRHLNSVRTDNRLCNLAYGTHSENMIDAAMIGRLGRQKLAVKDIKRIRKRINIGECVGDIAKEYSVCRRTILDIKNNDSFYWI